MSRDRIKSALDQVVYGVVETLDRVGPSAFPVFRDAKGEWVTTSEWNWASGHWIGLLWLAARVSPGRDRVQLEATATGLALRVASSEARDNIFYGMVAELAGFDGYDQTGDERLRQFGLSGARAMLALYHAGARQIPIGRHSSVGIDPRASDRDGTSYDRRFVAAVDVVATSVPVLWRAWTQTGDTAYREIAERHCDRHLEWHVRADGAIDQKTAFAPEDGRPLRTFSPLAASDDGCWSRGLAWHIAGTLQAYAATGADRYRAAAKLSLDFLLEHVGPDLIPRFDCLSSSGPLDTSAAAIIAWGITRSAPHSSEFLGIRDRLVATLVAEHLSPSGGLLNGCYSMSSGTATNSELIWGDYYLARSLDAIAGVEELRREVA